MNKKIETIGAAGANVPLLISLLKFSSLISKPMKDGVAEANNLSINELKVLICLSGEGAIGGQEISRLMSMPAMNVSRALTRLQKIGWLELVEDEGNRRRRPFRISAKGWQEYGSMLPDMRNVAARLFRHMNKKERIELQRLVELMNHQLEDGTEVKTAGALE